MSLRNPFSGYLGLGDLFARDVMMPQAAAGYPNLGGPSLTDDLIYRGPPSPVRPIGVAPLDTPPREVLLAAENANGDGGGPPVFQPADNATQAPIKPDFNAESRLNKFDGRPGYRPLYDGEAGGLTFENDVKGGPQTNRSVDARLADLLEGAAQDVVGFNINSTTGGQHGSAANDWQSPHYDGRAADIHRIGSMKKNEGLDVGDPKARHIVDGLVKYFASHPEVNQIIGPTGGWNVSDGKLDPITNRALLAAHRDHLHVGIRR